MTQTDLRQAELHLRLHLHGLVPLHQRLVDALCKSTAPPLELATALEDIGQTYVRMAETLNAEIIRQGRLDEEPEDPDDFAEARVARFAAEMMTAAGIVVFDDGMRVDAGAAFEAFPVAGEAIKAALLQARGKRGKVHLKSV